MSDENEKRVRRVRREDRKDTLPRSELSFPMDNETGSESPGFDLDALPLSDDAEDLSALTNLSDQEFRPPVITPREDRLPLLTRPEDRTPEPPSAPAESAPAKPKRAWFYNLLTLLFLLLTVAAIAWIALVWVDPQGQLNPFAPPTRIVFITATPPGYVESTLPTADSSGQIIIVATETPQASSAPTQSLYPFAVQQPVFYVANENDLGCNWWSIAGIVTAADGSALDGYRIRIIGAGVDEVVFSGAALSIGAGGYELPLIGAPQEADFVVQLFSPQEAPLSEPITVTTRADCDGNVTIVNFEQVR